LTTGVRILAAALLTAGVAGCSSSPHGDAAAPRPRPTAATVLSASLTTPTDITLRWRENEPDVAGHAVEFATAPHGRYTILGFLPAGQSTYKHPDLMPRTPFYYRVRPYFGPASRPVHVVLPEAAFKEKPKGAAPWANPRTLHGRTAAAHSIRDARTADAGAPAGLTATVEQGAGIWFRWSDHSRDEDGFLLEVRPAGGDVYRPVEVFRPDIDSGGLFALPAERDASFRVRAFYYGRRSNLAHRTTGEAKGDG
jgi:hypothetical protein